MKRESHVTPLFKRCIGGGRATSTSIYSSALSKPVGEHARAAPIASGTQSTLRAASRQSRRYLKRNCISGAPIVRPPLTAAQPRGGLTQRARISLAG